MWKRAALVLVAVALILAGDFGIRRLLAPRPENQKPGQHPEQVVYTRSADDVLNAGLLHAPPKEMAKPVAIVWIHGWGASFYLPSYVGIGRALAAQGYTTITANTRMHDIGNVAKYEHGKRVRGGGYWGVTSQDARDIKAWVDYAESLGFARIVLVGHSAGWASVARYQASTEDKRVAGLVFASGSVGGKVNFDPAQIAEAKKLVDADAGEDLIRLPNRSFPSFISAGTQLDMAETPIEYQDFFGTEIPNPAVLRVHCPLLAFYGTNGDIAGESELERIRKALERHAGSPRLETAMIKNGDHEYVGEEEQVAQTIAKWTATLRP